MLSEYIVVVDNAYAYFKIENVLQILSKVSSVVFYENLLSDSGLVLWLRHVYGPELFNSHAADI